MTRDRSVVSALIGRPYDIERFNCFHLLNLILREWWGIDLPEVNKVSIEKELECARVIKKYSKVFVELDIPDSECVALMNRGTHVGVYFDGAVVHNRIDYGVVYERLGMIRSMYPDVKFFRPVKA